MKRNPWLYRVSLCLVSFGLLLYPADLFAQSGDPADDDFWNETPAEPFVPKPGSIAPAAADAEKQQAPQYHMFVPYVGDGSSSSDEASAAAVDATWQTVVFEGFEGIWPAGCWWSTDYNGDDIPPTSPNTYFVWDDTNTKAKTGFWSAHPTDGPPYVNHTDTHMICGPLNFSAAAITDARVKFDYYLDSETYFDFFSYDYSCNGTANWAGGKSLSGQINVWKSVTQSLKSCDGKTNVYIRFSFKSDYISTDQGVWVDNVRVETFR